MATTVGYTGGTTENPTYHQVCSGNTGHAEAVLVEYDPEQISYEQLLQIFWDCHNPTTLNRQGVDIGTQYRSAIFFHDDVQQQLAEKSKQYFDAAQKYTAPAVTEIIPAVAFYPAEEYHQKYIEKNGGGHCKV